MVSVVASAAWGSAWQGALRLPATVSAATLVGLGLVLLIGGGLQLGSSLTPFPTPSARARLVTSGPYRFARHPMYGGGVLFAFGWSILFASVPTLTLAAALAVFADLKARREETWLLERYPDYDEYRRQVRHKLIPFIY
jgi:protein-S-isoprenylcysteine O-methyltransferase Ste14